MGLIDDEKVPLRLKYFAILVELAAHLLGASEVLHRGEIDVFVALCSQLLQTHEGLALVA